MNLKKILNAIEYEDIIHPIDDLEITTVNSPEDANENSMVFIFRKIKNQLNTKAKVIVTKERLDSYQHCQIIHKNPRLAMAQVIEYLFPLYQQSMVHSIHEQAIIGENSKLSEPVQINAFSTIGSNSTIGKGTVIHSNVTIGKNCSIGEDCIIHPNVTIYDNTAIGNKTVIHGGATIAADGFGYENNNGIWHKINHIGTVIIGDNVEIGANSCVDRAVLGKTQIGNGVKIDNLVQIAHNCIIGENSIIVAGSLIGGSVNLGRNCIIAGNAAISDGVTIGDNTTVLAKSGVTKDHKGDQALSGYPAANHKEESRYQAFLRRKFKSNN